MALYARHCIVLICDTCQDGWAGLDGEPHFDSRADAVAYATAAGWAITSDQALCGQCTSVEACERAGHTPGPWIAAGPFPNPDGSTWQGRVRYCIACSKATWDPPVARAKRPGGVHRSAG